MLGSQFIEQPRFRLLKTIPRQYVRVGVGLGVRLGTIVAMRMRENRAEYLFHPDQRLADRTDDFWVFPSDVEPIERPTTSEVLAINRLIKHGSE